jgi:hypothetical protein
LRIEELGDEAANFRISRISHLIVKVIRRGIDELMELMVLSGGLKTGN